MNKDRLEALLADHRSELKARGVRSLAVFGSAARGQTGPQSDVDLIVEFDGTPDFDRYMDLRLYLEDLLGRKVDLVTPAGLKPRVRAIVEREAVRVA